MAGKRAEPPPPEPGENDRREHTGEPELEGVAQPTRGIGPPIEGAGEPSERVGPLKLSRLIKSDGRALILYERA